MSTIRWNTAVDGTLEGEADFIDYRIPVYPGCENEKAKWQEVHNTRVAAIAAANGYVKLSDDKILLDRDDVQALCDRVLMDCGCDSCNAVTRIQIALEAKP